MITVKNSLRVLSVAGALGPIYWIPFVSPAQISIFKAAILAILVSLLLILGRSAKIGYSKIIWSLLILVLACVSSMLHMDLFAAGFAVLIFFYLLGSMTAKSVSESMTVKAIKNSYLIFSVFPIMVVVDWAAGGIIVNPYYEYQMFASSSGFQGGRTGWAVASNFFLAIGFALMLQKKVALTKIQSTIIPVIQILIIANIVFVGARGGLIVSILLFLTYSFLTIRNGAKGIISFIGVAILAIGGGFVFGSDAILESRAISSFREGSTTTSSADQSGGRFAGFELALDYITDAPLEGNGHIDLKEDSLEYSSIHNMWLKIAAERGIIFLIAFFCFFLFSFSKAARGGGALVTLPVFAMFVSSMFEPTVFSGNFFFSFYFWLILGYFGSITHPTERKPGQRIEGEKMPAPLISHQTR